MNSSTLNSVVGNLRLCEAANKNLPPAPAPVVAWEVEINYMSCVVFAPTKAKARWLAVKSYWDAFGRNGTWPSSTIARKPFYDRFPHKDEPKAFSPEYVRSLC